MAAANRLQVEGCGSEMLQIACKWETFLGEGVAPYHWVGEEATELGTGNICACE